MTERTKRRLGDILIEDGILTREGLGEALEHQKKQGGGMIGQILIRLGYISEENLVVTLSKQLNVPYLNLVNYAVNVQAVQAFNEEFCRKNMVIPFDVDEKHIFIGVSDPLNDIAIEEIQKQSKLKPQVFISTPAEILNMLDLAFSSALKKKES